MRNWRERPQLRAMLAAVLAWQLALGPLAVPMEAADSAGVVRFGGQPLPGVTVTAQQGNVKKTAVTDLNGAYKFTDLADGTWTIQTSMLLFAPQTKDVKASENAEWDLTMIGPQEIAALSIAPPAEAAQGPVLATGNRPATPAAKPGATQTNTRSAFQRAELSANANGQAPGQTPAQPATADTSELRQQSADGLLVNGSVNNGAASPFSQLPAFGNNRRGLRSLYNGNIGLIENNSNLNARVYSLTGQDTPKPATNQLQGVFAFGGPLKIPKLLPRNGPNFTINYQWTRNTNSTVSTGLVPTADQRMGILSDRVIPQSMITPQALALLQYYPLPNFTGNNRYNYQVPLVNHAHGDNLQTRLNRAIGRRDQVQGQFAFSDNRTDTPNLFGFLDTGRTLGINSSAGWRHQFSPRFFINSQVQYSRQAISTVPYFSNRFNVSGAAGITGNLQQPLYWGPPTLDFNSITTLSGSNPAHNRNQTTGMTEDFFYSHGRHNFTGGGGIQRQEFNILSQQDPRGTFNFTGQATGSDFGGFLLGIPDTSSIAFGNADKYLRATNGNAWVADDWRVNPGLTVNIGARWDYWGPDSERYGRLVNLVTGPNFTSVNPVVSGSPLNANRHNVSPRLAFSWRPLAASSMIIRGGYGIYYDTSIYQNIVTQMAQQAPLSTSLRIQNTAANPITLANGFSSPGTTTPDTYAVDPSLKLGYSQNWQVSLQRDLPFALQMVAIYSGVKGTHAQQQILPNTYPAGVENPCSTCPSGYTYLMSNGNSRRNAGELQMRRRLRSGLTALLDYTYSKSFDDGLLGGRGGSFIAQNWLDTRADWGRSTFDQRHNIQATLQYTSGMGLRGSIANNWKGKILRSWTFGAQYNGGTGLPLNPVYLAPATGTGVIGTVRASATGADPYAAPSGLFLNPAAFTAPAPGQWGNAQRNSLTGPAQFSFNGNMSRSFQMKDRYTIDFRLDVNNVLNHVVYSSYVATINSAQFGLPTGANGMRTVQTSVRMRF